MVLFGWWRGHQEMACFWFVWGTLHKCKNVTYTGNVGQVVDAANIGGGDIVFSAKRSNPHTMQYAVELWVCGGGDIVFSAKRSNPHSMQYAVKLLVCGDGDAALSVKSSPMQEIESTQ